MNTDSIAKTGQSLIANPIFDSLPSSPAASTEESMQVDSASTPAPTTEGDEKEKETPKASSKPKYTAPVDGQTEDLILEGTAYLRLLLILMNLDAGKVEEVSQLSWTSLIS
jgi:26S proteasome regulatory subunit N3